MKRVFLSGFVLLSLISVDSLAQNNRYDDDIYVTGKDARKMAKEEEKAQEENRRRQVEEANERSEREGNSAVYNSSGDEDAYIDYDDDDYYSNRFNRFGTYSFYRPYWYDPWYGPNWGWGPSWGVGYGWNSWGYGSGWSVSVGYGGPYWSSYWGWNNWYGYPAYYSCWNYPYYGYGWGGYGGGYYNGYWDGYYNGIYSNGAYANRYTYGPRNSMNNRYSGLRSSSGRPSPGYSTTQQQQRMATGSASGTRPAMTEPMRREPRNINAAPRELPSNATGDRPSYGNNTPESRPVERERFYNRGEGNYSNGTIENRPQYEQRPRYEQSQPRYEQQSRPQSEPRYQQRSEPSYSRPSYSQPSSAPSRSFGGGSGSGSAPQRGGSFGGRR